VHDRHNHGCAKFFGIERASLLMADEKGLFGSGISDIDLELRRLGDEDIDAWSALLTPQERVRAGRFRQSDDRRRCILGRGLLRKMLGRRLARAPASLMFSANPHGKPTLVDAGEIAFNVSHSGDYVLVAVGIRSGIDLTGVGRRVFTPAERAMIAGAPEAEKALRFFRQWTFKEAVVKAVGLGLSLDLKRFEIVFLDGAPRLVSHGAVELGAASDWRLTTVAMEGAYSAALAVRPWQRGSRA
jgi:4'-phosphopantetheinyl transferase